MRTVWIGIVTLLVMSGISLGAMAQEKLTADEILGKMDQKINGHTDQEMSVKLTVYDTDGSTKEYLFTIQQKGNSKRLVRFTSGEVKGMAILAENQERVYVYLPGYKKVRRVASHNMNQSLVGSDLSNSDMATASYPEVYTPALDHEDADYWYLKLTPKKPEDSAYAWAIIKIGKKDYLQWQTDYYNAAGEMVKRFKADKAKLFPGMTDAWHSWIEYSDPRTGHRTTLDVLDLKVDQGLKDSMFTTRQLQWSK